MRKAAEVIVPAELLSEFIAPPAPKVAPAAQATRAHTAQASAEGASAQAHPGAHAHGHQRPHACAQRVPTGVTTPQPPAPPITEPVAAAPCLRRRLRPGAAQDRAALQRRRLPNNPKPSYPAISKRMGEQGKVVLRVLIGTDGAPQKVEINKSSGYERLDRQAQEAVMRWRFVPGKRNGVP